MVPLRPASGSSIAPGSRQEPATPWAPFHRINRAGLSNRWKSVNGQGEDKCFLSCATVQYRRDWSKQHISRRLLKCVGKARRGQAPAVSALYLPCTHRLTPMADSSWNLLCSSLFDPIFHLFLHIIIDSTRSRVSRVMTNHCNGVRNHFLNRQLVHAFPHTAL